MDLYMKMTNLQEMLLAENQFCQQHKLELYPGMLSSFPLTLNQGQVKQAISKDFGVLKMLICYAFESGMSFQSTILALAFFTVDGKWANLRLKNRLIQGLGFRAFISLYFPQQHRLSIGIRGLVNSSKNVWFHIQGPQSSMQMYKHTVMYNTHIISVESIEISPL